MKKFTLKAITLATASICGSAAFAGTVTAPATPVKYAVEAITNTTDITLPPITYSMGVARTQDQNFTVIIEAPPGSAIIPASCTANPVTFGGLTWLGTPAASSKRASATECAYEIDIDTLNTDGSTVGATLTFTGLQLTSHTLATAGALSTQIALKDLGETAFIDNSGPLPVNLATSGQALTITATPADTLTVANVTDLAGPLFGFVVANDDLQYTARATFQINNNTSAAGASRFNIADGLTDFDFNAHGTSLALTIPGNFSGLAANGLNLEFDGTVYPVTVTAGVGTVTIPASDFAAAIYGPRNARLWFTASGTTSLGTSRTFGVSGTSDSVVGADQTVAGNSAWWVWGANASQLVSTIFNTNVNYITRFFFLNTGTTPVGYTVQCFTEGGGTVTNGAAGVLAANATTNVTASAACTFPPTVPRGSAIFTISAPINTIKGSYQSILPNGESSSIAPLVRPYNANTTE